MKKRNLNRRNFLRNTSLGFLGTGFLGKKGFVNPIQDQENELPKIKEYRTLGRTGFKVSEIGYGNPKNPGLIRAAIESGVNYFDTGRFYGNSENDLGKAIQDFDRESLFITTKLYTQNLGSKKDILEKLNASFENLGVDHLDCLILQGVESKETVKHHEFHAVFDQLQQEGRVSYRGIACHSSYVTENEQDTMENILLTAVDDGRFDLMLLVYNFLFSEQGERVLRACKEKDIATTIMKTNPVRSYHSFEEYKQNYDSRNEEMPEALKTMIDRYKGYYEDAMAYLEANGISDHDEKLSDVATKFVLSNKDVDCCLIDFKSFAGLEKHLAYSGQALDTQAMNQIRVFKKALGRMHCRIGCNVCESHCPWHIPVNTILRYHYYFTVKGQEKYAMKKYRDLFGSKPDLCTYCEGFCEKACPYGVLTRPLLAMAHQNLSFERTV